MEIRYAQLQDILNAREQRVFRQRELLAGYPQTLICFTMNIAGPVKNSDLILRAWREGLDALDAQLRTAGLQVGYREQTVSFTGNEAFLSVPADPLRVKALTVELEEHHPLGRLFDMDVLRPDGSKTDRQAVGSPPRRCLICGGPAAACASRRIHPAQALQKAANEMMERFFAGKFADRIASLVTRALLYETAVTPKPGLVDRANNGSHRDMDFYTFLASAAALTPWFRDMVLAGVSTAETTAGGSMQKLQALGKAAEGAMRSATGNVNTHKGAIFSMGVVCGALGRLYGRGEAITPERVFDEAAVLGKQKLEQFVRAGGSADTAGGRQFRDYGLTGARGEAAAGFPAVCGVGLPALKKALAEGRSCDEAGYEALLRLMAAVTDTNMIARSDRGVQRQVQENLAARLEAGDFTREQAEALDREFIRRNLSPGGCADLLAVSWLFLFLEQEDFESYSNAAVAAM